MIRKKIIRCTCLLMLLLCIIFWVISYFSELRFGYFGNISGWVVITPGRVGGIVQIFAPSPSGTAYYTPITGRWRFSTRNPVPYSWWLTPASDWGFYVGREPRPIASSYGPLVRYCAYIPFWFLTLLSSLLLFFVWRKTRPGNSGRAFPIESKSVLPPTIRTDPPSPPRSPP